MRHDIGKAIDDDLKGQNMGTSEVETIKEIQGRENIFVAYFRLTKLPLCNLWGRIIFNDQAWFFAEEEAIKEFGKRK